MSLINFLNSKLKPSVEYDGVCEDGYSALNLIADDEEQLARGFMSFAVTKPPVEIIFDFPKAIDLKVIKLWNSNANLRSTAFEVHGKYEGIWERVGFVRDLDKVDAVTFCYQSDYNSRSNGESGSEKAFFFKTANKILSNTNTVKITIRSTNKCPPILRKAQIWGLPSRSLDKADRELVKTIWSEITNPCDQHAAQQQQSGQRSPSRPELHDNSSLTIPEAFLDSITWELMIFPTVLPSGKVVDQSTIDKHSEVEAKWGRMPSDPFTGLEFTSQRKAILNLALKARIEKFLLENSEQFKSVPRSLGSSRVRRSKNRHASQFASLLCQSHRSSTYTGGHYVALSSTASTTGYKSFSATSTLSSLPQTRSSTAPSELLPSKRLKLNDTSTYRCDKLPPAATATQTATATAAASYTTSSSDAAATAAAASNAAGDGIDDAIRLALQKITRYTHLPSLETNTTACIGCQKEMFAYEIQTCKHLVCRDCLVQFTKRQLCVCNVSFCNADVERYHK